MKRATFDNDVYYHYQRYFNPRPREEGDCSQWVYGKRADKISIHALVKRATEFAKYKVLTAVISIHALVKRATPTPTP